MFYKLFTLFAISTYLLHAPTKTVSFTLDALHHQLETTDIENENIDNDVRERLRQETNRCIDGLPLKQRNYSDEDLLNIVNKRLSAEKEAFWSDRRDSFCELPYSQEEFDKWLKYDPETKYNVVRIDLTISSLTISRRCRRKQ